MAVAVIALSVGFINNRSGLRTTDLHLDSNVRAADKPGGMETGRVSEAVWCLEAQCSCSCCRQTAEDPRSGERSYPNTKSRRTTRLNSLMSVNDGELELQLGLRFVLANALTRRVTMPYIAPH